MKVRKQILLTKKQVLWLKENVGKRQESEIIRRAIDEYIEKKEESK